MNQAAFANSIKRVMPVAIASERFTSLCTIQRPPGTTNAQGGQDLDPTHYIDVPGLVNIPCKAAPLVILRPSAADETKLADYTEEGNQQQVVLSGYFPQIQQQDQAVVDGVIYDIVSVQSDSEHIMTRLGTQIKTL